MYYTLEAWRIALENSKIEIARLESELVDFWEANSGLNHVIDENIKNLENAMSEFKEGNRVAAECLVKIALNSAQEAVRKYGEVDSNEGDDDKDDTMAVVVSDLLMRISSLESGKAALEDRAARIEGRLGR